MKTPLNKWQWFCLIVIAYGISVVVYATFKIPDQGNLYSEAVLNRLSDESLLLLTAGKKSEDTISVLLINGEKARLPSATTPQQEKAIQSEFSEVFIAQKKDIFSFLIRTFFLWAAPSLFIYILLKCLTEHSSYLIEGRLADVLALIQVLSVDQYAHRSEKGLCAELQGAPISAMNWLQIALRHPEFFRVASTGEKRVSLLVRHATEPSNNMRPPLTPDHASKLLQLAVDLHDRELRRSQGWHVWVPLIVAITAGFFTLFGIWLRNVLSTP